MGGDEDLKSEAKLSQKVLHYFPRSFICHSCRGSCRDQVLLATNRFWLSCVVFLLLRFVLNNEEVTNKVRQRLYFKLFIPLFQNLMDQ